MNLKKKKKNTTKKKPYIIYERFLHNLSAHIRYRLFVTSFRKPNRISYLSKLKKGTNMGQ